MEPEINELLERYKQTQAELSRAWESAREVVYDVEERMEEETDAFERAMETALISMAPIDPTALEDLHYITQRALFPEDLRISFLDYLNENINAGILTEFERPRQTQDPEMPTVYLEPEMFGFEHVDGALTLRKLQEQAFKRGSLDTLRNKPAADADSAIFYEHLSEEDQEEAIVLVAETIAEITKIAQVLGYRGVIIDANTSPMRYSARLADRFGDGSKKRRGIHAFSKMLLDEADSRRRNKNMVY